MTRAARVDGAHLIPIFCFFGRVYGRPRRTVYHRVGLRAQEALPHRFCVRDVQPLIGHGTYRASVLRATVCGRKIAADSLVPAPCQFIHHVVA